MAAVASSPEAGGSTKSRSRLLAASLSSLVLGLVVYASGVITYSIGWHDWNYWSMGDDMTTAFHMMEWGQWAEGAGVILVILGLVFYVARKRKGV
ncbi:MAG TPA: hypothetical protein VGB78_06675 [Thermoplasmata archaeon]|jgi:predicted membrane channel-forming protein YqfA (hemolysin III family)